LQSCTTNPSEGKWRSDIYPKNDKEWNTWKDSYRDFILRYAKIAESANAEMFCLGAELTQLTKEKEDYWKALIREVRTIYSGELTYAANWYKEYEDIKFWGELDYIGVQGYFPLVKSENPSIDKISKGWKKYSAKLESLHEKFNRQIIFTEMGYKSTACSAIRPWEWLENKDRSDVQYSDTTQANCYSAFFKSIWPKPWFSGVHIWQMRADYQVRTDRKNMDFFPQGKLAEEIISKGYGSKK